MDEALRWYNLSALQGYAPAQYNLGLIYANGQGVIPNKRIAKDWFGKACDNGFQEGCDRFRELKEQGIE